MSGVGPSMVPRCPSAQEVREWPSARRKLRVATPRLRHCRGANVTGNTNLGHRTPQSAICDDPAEKCPAGTTLTRDATRSTRVCAGQRTAVTQKRSTVSSKSSRLDKSLLRHCCVGTPLNRGRRRRCRQEQTMSLSAAYWVVSTSSGRALP